MGNVEIVDGPRDAGRVRTGSVQGLTSRPTSGDTSTMSDTIRLDETITVERPLHEVFAYISEFSRIEEWTRPWRAACA